MKIESLSVAVLSFGFMATSATAQVPPSASPGRVDERFTPPALPQSKADTIIPQAQTVDPTNDALATFTLSSISVDGSTVFKQSDFASLYQPLLGRSVTVRDIYRVRDAVTAKYRAAGYTLSQAILGPQNLAGGSVRIQVVEGYIDRFSIEGDADDARGIVAKTAGMFVGHKPLRQADLERYTLLLNDLPGLSVNTVLKPSETVAGAADLVIVLKRTKVQAGLALDSYGSQAVGPFQVTANVDFNNLFGISDQTSLMYANALPTSELRYLSLRNTQVLGTNGARLIFSVSNSLTEPGGAIATLSARGLGMIASVFGSFPVIRQRSQSLKLEAGLTYQDTLTDLLGLPYSKDRVRYFTARATYDVSDRAFGLSASTLTSLEIAKGLDIFGASKNANPFISRANGRSDFTLVAAQLTRIQQLTNRSSLMLSVTGQYAFDPLLSSQQFGLGGRRFGRGYEPSELTSDNGIGVTIEPRVDFSQPALKARGQVYIFYDIGMVGAKTPLVGQPSRETLSSAGIGIRLSIGRHLSAQFELAKPLTRNLTATNDRRLRPLFSVSANF